jgi:hypothetical protein
MAKRGAGPVNACKSNTAIALALFLTVAAAAALSAPSSPAGDSGSRPRPATSTTNLRVLPKDTDPTEMRELMSRYAQELGVKCAFCHVRNPQTQRLDYVSDDNPRKQIARVMIRMVDDINNKYLAQISDPRYAERIGCGNCHHGQSSPPQFIPDGRL